LMRETARLTMQRLSDTRAQLAACRG
jgi:hypothetical protein